MPHTYPDWETCELPRRAAPELPPLIVPSDLPKHARDTLARFDDGITRAVGNLAMEADTLRRSAELYREQRDELRARDADRLAALYELDPRLYIAGCMHNVATDGTTKLMLHTYIALIQEQAEARKNIARAAA